MFKFHTRTISLFDKMYCIKFTTKCHKSLPIPVSILFKSCIDVTKVDVGMDGELQFHEIGLRQTKAKRGVESY